MALRVPWTKIKTEYYQGVTPKELATKYKLTAKQISDKAHKEGWVAEKAKIYENVRENTEEKIGRLTNLALDKLEEILNGSNSRPDFVNAIGKVLDISGLKSSKQEITGKDGAPVGIQKIYVTPDDVEKVKEHINSVLNG